ncbi:hypothetical protein [Frankia sp. Cas3]|nr:hypothetical protein [Frankia sp. Cas3]
MKSASPELGRLVTDLTIVAHTPSALPRQADSMVDEAGASSLL